MTGILTITINPAIDVNTTVDNVDVERKLRCSTPTHEPGGGGLNVSCATYKVGGDSTAFYTSGGVTGNMLQNLLDQEGINHRPPISGGSYATTPLRKNQIFIFGVWKWIKFTSCHEITK